MNFWNKLSRRIFPFILALTALAISASAAFYSVTGLGALFAGAFMAVVIMAGTLEASKLVIASALYRYWSEVNKALRIYLFIALFVLITITSAGIYGFLTAAYQETANKSDLVNSKTELLDSKLKRYQAERDEYLDERGQISDNISDLTAALGNNTIQYTDTSGRVITSQSSSQRRVLQENLDDAKERRTYVNNQLDIANDSIASLEEQKIEIAANNEVAVELGPLIFISELIDKPMSWVINKLVLLIIFVFDPLAITLVVLANFAFEQVKIKEDELESNDEFNKEEPTESLSELEDLKTTEAPVEPVVDNVVEPTEPEIPKELETEVKDWKSRIKKFIKH